MANKLTDDMRRLMRVFSNMKNRCYSENNHAYSVYGGKGVKICDLWLANEYKFVEWGLKTGYKPGLTIDRFDSDGDYEPSNCRWLTLSENSSKKPLPHKPIPWKDQPWDQPLGEHCHRYLSLSELSWVTGYEIKELQPIVDEIVSAGFAHQCQFHNSVDFDIESVRYVFFRLGVKEL